MDSTRVGEYVKVSPEKQDKKIKLQDLDFGSLSWQENEGARRENDQLLLKVYETKIRLEYEGQEIVLDCRCEIDFGENKDDVYTVDLSYRVYKEKQELFLAEITIMYDEEEPSEPFKKMAPDFDGIIIETDIRRFDTYKGPGAVGNKELPKEFGFHFYRQMIKYIAKLGETKKILHQVDIEPNAPKADPTGWWHDKFDPILVEEYGYKEVDKLHMGKVYDPEAKVD